MSRESEVDPSAFQATQKYLSITSGRPLSYAQPYQAASRESGDYSHLQPLQGKGLAHSGEPLITQRSSMSTTGHSTRRSREERLASLKSTVRRQEDISMV